MLKLGGEGTGSSMKKASAGIDREAQHVRYALQGT